MGHFTEEPVCSEERPEQRPGKRKGVSRADGWRQRAGEGAAGWPWSEKEGRAPRTWRFSGGPAPNSSVRTPSGSFPPVQVRPCGGVFWFLHRGSMARERPFSPAVQTEGLGCLACAIPPCGEPPSTGVRGLLGRRHKVKGCPWRSLHPWSRGWRSGSSFSKLPTMSPRSWPRILNVHQNHVGLFKI